MKLLLTWVGIAALGVACVQDEDVGVFAEGSPDAAPTFENLGDNVWSHSFGAGGHDRALTAVVDDDGGVVIAGHFSGSVDFGGGEIGGSGTVGLFARFDAAGNHVWSRATTGSGHTEVFETALAPDGAIVATGVTLGAVDFGDGIVVDQGSAFLNKYSAEGELVWSVRLGDHGIQGRDLAIADGGDIVTSGYFYGTWSAGGVSFTADQAGDMYVARFTTDGDLVWARRSEGIGHATGHGVAASPDGVYVVGQIGGWDYTADESFGHLTEVSRRGISDGYVARYRANGEVDWLRRFSGRSNSIAVDVDVTSDGTAIVVGDFGDDLTIGDELHDVAGSGLYLAALDTEGEVVWSRAISTNGVSFSVDVGPADEVAFAGWYDNGADFGGGLLSRSEGLFVSKYTSAGDYVVASSFGADGPSTDIAFDVALANDAIVFAGKVSNDGVDFGRGPVSVAGEADMFVAKFEPPPVPRE